MDEGVPNPIQDADGEFYGVFLDAEERGYNPDADENDANYVVIDEDED